MGASISTHPITHLTQHILNSPRIFEEERIMKGLLYSGWVRWAGEFGGFFKYLISFVSWSQNRLDMKKRKFLPFPPPLWKQSQCWKNRVNVEIERQIIFWKVLYFVRKVYKLVWKVWKVWFPPPNSPDHPPHPIYTKLPKNSRRRKKKKRFIIFRVRWVVGEFFICLLISK